MTEYHAIPDCMSACKADLILHNGKILTVGKDFTTVEALAVKDGRILDTGTTEQMTLYRDTATKVVDLEGRTAMPGINDSHLHVLGTGFALKMINCRTPPMKSIEDIKKAVAEKVAESKPGEWIIGRGWDQAKLAEHRNPTRYDLDEVAPDNPVFLTRTCQHVDVVNSKAMEIAGVTKDTPDPVGGRVVRDADGEPVGIFEEPPARNLIRRHMPKQGIPETVEAIRAACKEFNMHGITSVTDGGDTEDDIVAYQTLREAGGLTVRVNMMIRARKGDEPLEQSLDRIRAFPMSSGYGDDLLRLQGVKILIDGGVGGRTALLREPYENDPENLGLLTTPVADLQRLVDESNKRGLLTGIHCAGGKAMDIVLEAYRNTDKIRPIKGRRFYIIHAYQPSPDNFKTCRELGVQVASQPSFLYYLGDSYHENVGPERSRWLKPHRAWIDEGVMMAGGTDSPVTPFYPFPSLWTAVARRTEVKGTQMGTEQKVTREEAVRMFTVNGAYLTFEEGIKGSLERGKVADMILLDRDIMTCPEDDIRDTVVLKTWLGGKLVYEA